MSQFHLIKAAVQKQFDKIKGWPLFYSKADRNTLWDTYIQALTEAGQNEIYRERGEHDCQCCKHFVRKIGNILAISPTGELVSIWDIEPTGTFYDEVARIMAGLTRHGGIRSSFFIDSDKVGTDYSVELIGGKPHTWEHFYVEVPSNLVVHNGTERAERIGRSSERMNSLKLSVEKLTIASVMDVLDLVEQNVLYRGAEFKGALVFMRDTLMSYHACKGDKVIWLWKTSLAVGDRANLRGSVIGTLVEDLSSGVPLEAAVKSFETKVAPTNYKRTTALVTPNMIKEAEKTIETLGVAGSLERRHAVITDITVDNVLFADRAAKVAMSGGVLGVLKDSVTDNVDVSKAGSIPIDTFLSTVVPSASKIEAYLSNSVAASNAMTLLAPVNPEAPSILKWDNNFTWAYNGDVTDGIKELVKKAGGKVEGALRISLGWHNSDDLDLWVKAPGYSEIYYGDKQGLLDVDMNAWDKKDPVSPVENVIFPRHSQVKDGTYRVHVYQFSRRNPSCSKGYTVEIEYDGKLYTFTSSKPCRDKELAVEFTIKNGSISFNEKHSLPMTAGEYQRDTWSLSTCKFHRVSSIMHSPNHWDGQGIGNKHTFFILDGFKNPEPVRGFFTEFLRDDLLPHRKVLELLGSKVKVLPEDNQLSGLGFSSTVRNSLVVRVTDAAGKARLYNVQF